MTAPAGDDALIINERLSIPRHELFARASRAGGAGGQHVNTSSTRIEILWNPRTSAALDDATRARLLEKLRGLESLDGVGHVRGLGLMAAVEVVADKATKQLFPPTAGLTQKLTDALLDRGLYTRVALDCICLAPPLVTSDAIIDRIVDTVRETIPAVLNMVREQVSS